MLGKSKQKAKEEETQQKMIEDKRYIVFDEDKDARSKWIFLISKKGNGKITPHLIMRTLCACVCVCMWKGQRN